ncbi:MAG: Cold shock protein CspA [Alphaproteobacteria bacterium MarineAlpha9_Bin4]|nr:cold-shock protein [Pelagibacterales bacterium]PPR25599.1 MAG: Cold shock protein CspA [Alphaproteobacteria bacterium MarineAlpha9_Bin4]|tara:strand:- start:276 stop:485 length:210 start_codon:yes stop_codon:yes gene_type:complete
MFTGKVKWFNSQKGYGFISPDNGTKDVFVHISALQTAGITSLKENDAVSYDETRNNGRVSAGNLKLIES